MTNLEIAAELATGKIWLWSSIGDGVHRLDPKNVKHMQTGELFVGPAGRDVGRDAEWAIFVGSIDAPNPLVEALRGNGAS